MAEQDKDPMFDGIVRGAQAAHRRQQEQAERKRQEAEREANDEDGE
jgi:hypothetical protein